jgi:hypothetical protein
MDHALCRQLAWRTATNGCPAYYLLMNDRLGQLESRVSSDRSGAAMNGQRKENQ